MKTDGILPVIEARSINSKIKEVSELADIVMLAYDE